MSMGIGARAELIIQDDCEAVYRYGAFNWNIPECKNAGYEMDGRIAIKKNALPIIEFHNRNSKKATDKKGAVKKVINRFTLEEMIKNEYVTIKNSRYCWRRDNELDVMAATVVYKIIRMYEKEGELPEKLSILS